MVVCNQVFACIFQAENSDGSSPFWPSNNIEVCFANPNPSQDLSVENNLDFEYRTHISNTIQTIKNTVETQINQRTPFNLNGFGFCPDNEQGESLGGLPPKIRIDLNGIQGSGAMAMSIGPHSSDQATNITLDSLSTAWPGGVKPADPNAVERIRTFNDQKHMSWKSLHEILHILGLHHSEYWDKDMTGSDPRVTNVIQFGTGLDENSVMNRSASVTYDARGLAVLSENDVACLTRIADRSILNFSTRPVFLPNVDIHQPGFRTPTQSTKPLPTGQSFN